MSKRPFNAIGRLLVLVLLIGGLALSLAGAQTSGITETKLDNGLTVLMKESHAAPVFTAQIWFKVGSRNEYNGITGISHMLEHMLFNSSKNYAKGEISKLIRERGGIENAATWTDFTYYWQLLSSDNLELSLKTLAERAGNALLLRDELQKERTVVLSELQGDENDPDTLLFDDVFAAAFKAHPYHWPTIGWESDVENINRDQLWDYYHTYYHPNNATLVLVGDFNPAKALELIKKYFGPIPAHELPRPVYTVEPVQHGERDVVVRREGNAQRALIGVSHSQLDRSRHLSADGPGSDPERRQIGQALPVTCRDAVGHFRLVQRRLSQGPVSVRTRSNCQAGRYRGRSRSRAPQGSGKGQGSGAHNPGDAGGSEPT